MTLKIEKLPSGNTKIDFTHSTSKKPVSVELTPQQIAQAIQMLSIAEKSTAFKFQLHLPQ